MIFVHDKGQMCNNILQYAHVFAWARENNRRTVSMRFAYKYQYFHICDTPYHNFLMYLIGKYGGKMKLLPTVHYDMSQEGRAEKNQFVLSHRHVIMEGWGLRYYDLVMKHLDEIRKLFAFKPEIEEKLPFPQGGEGSGEWLRIGVHIRRGDYRTFMNGRFYFDDDAFIQYIKETIRLFADGKDVEVYICGNDPNLDKQKYIDALQSTSQKEQGRVEIYFPEGNPGEDLCLLSHCDYIIGPPSSFSLIATMYRDNKLCWMTHDRATITAEDFKTFDQNFCIFDDYFK